MALTIIFWTLLILTMHIAFVISAVLLLLRLNQNETCFQDEEKRLQRIHCQEGIPKEICLDLKRRHLRSGLKLIFVYLGLILFLGTADAAIFFYFYLK